MDMSFVGLNELGKGAGSWKMFQAVGGRQLLKVQKRLQKFMNWWLENVE
jgi:hypothetical protein